MPKRLTKEDWRRYQRLYGERGKKLKKIMEKILVPTVRKVGHDGSRAAWLIAQHSPLVLMQEVLNKYQAAYYKDPNNIFYQGIPFMVDRIRLSSSKAQIYGTQSYINVQDKTCLFPVWDFKHVNQRRRRFGLAPLSTRVNGAWPRKEDPSL